MNKENEMVTIPYFVHEGDMARLERSNKRMFILVILLIMALIGSNFAWIMYERQFEVTETTITQENLDGINNYIGNDGEINNGKADY